MADRTRIPWARSTWNPMTGCTPISEGCQHCYAERMAGRNLPVTRCPECAGSGIGHAPGPYACDACGGTGNVGFTPTFHPDRLDIPLHWRKPRRIFVCSMSDLFHEAFTDEQRYEVWSVIERAPQHTFMILTKRPTKMRWWFNNRCPGLSPLPNLYLGVTVENQARADERIPILLDTPAAVRFVSVEPMLGPVDLTKAIPDCQTNAKELWWPGGGSRGLHWVIVGGESGPGARPMRPEWALDVWRQCKAAGVPFYWKQWSDAGPFGEPSGAILRMTSTRELPEAVQL